MSIKTVVELDLVGYSDVARILEEHVSAEVVSLFNEQIQEFVDRGLRSAGAERAQVVLAKTGDGAILAFDGPEQAHGFAVGVHQATQEHNAKRSVTSSQRWFRIGIATGDLYQGPNGAGQNVAGTVIANAVRLEAAARPGEILADASTFAALRPELQDRYGAEESVAGKREERFAARRCRVVPYSLPKSEKAYDRNAGDRSKLPPVQALPERHRLPYRSLGDKFVGRVEVLWQMYDALHRNGTAVVQGVGVVAGTGGLGKSQLAIEYAHRFGAGYGGGVYWVDADRGLGTLLSQVSEAARIEIDTRADEREQLQQLWAGMNRRPAALIVLDNFPEKIALRPYLPTTGLVHTLVTTRRQDVVSAYPNVLLKLNTLTREAGIELLNSGVRQLEDSEAAALVEKLGGLPLALELTKSYLNYRTDAGLKEVLADMQAAGAMGMLHGFAEEYRDELPSGHELDIVQTFQRSWELAPEGAKKMLRVMADLAPVPVPAKILRLVLQECEEGGRPDTVGRDLSELSRLSLVELDGSSNNAVMHRLIQEFVRYRNGVDQVSLFESTAVVVTREMGRTYENPDAAGLRELELVVPHAEALLESNRLTAEDATSLLSSAGEHHRMLGRYTAARKFAAAALQTNEQTFAPGHTEIAAMQSNLAGVLQDLGELAEARDLLRKALASDEQSFAPGHPFIATSQSNLAAVLQDLGELAEARDLLRKALGSAEQSFAPGHPSTATMQSNLAAVLKDLGELEEARELHRKALASDEQSFTSGHPSIARSQSNLALVLRDLGELEEARELLRKALASAEQSFAPGHPSTATMQSNLALALRDLGELEEARGLLRKALASAEQSFAPGHPSIAMRQSALALVLQDLGELEEARELLRKALASTEQSFARGHPSIATVQSNLAMVLKDLGELEEARDLERKAAGSAPGVRQGQGRVPEGAKNERKPPRESSFLD